MLLKCSKTVRGGPDDTSTYPDHSFWTRIGEGKKYFWSMPRSDRFWHIQNLQQNDFDHFLEKFDFPATISQYGCVWRFQNFRKHLEEVLKILLHTQIIVFGRVLVNEKNISEACQDWTDFGISKFWSKMTPTLFLKNLIFLPPLVNMSVSDTSKTFENI